MFERCRGAGIPRRIGGPGPGLEATFASDDSPDERFRAITSRVYGKRRVFPDALVIGKPVATFHKSFKSAFARADLPKTVRSHDVRHTFWSWLALHAPYAILRDLMGPSPGNVTSTYLHVQWKEKLSAIDALPRQLSGGTGATKTGGAPRVSS